jgi:hypothetical protein
VGTGQTTEKGPLGSFENPYAGIATLTPTYDPYTGLPTNQVPGMKHGGAVAHYATGGASVPAETGQGMLNALPALPAAQPGNNQAVLESMNKMFSGMASTSPPAPQSPAAMNDYMSSLMATPYNPNWTGPVSAPASTPTTPPPGGNPPTTPPGLPKFPGGNLADLLNYTANSGGGANAAMPQYTYDPVTGQYTQQGGGLDFLRGGIHMAHGGMLDGSTYAAGGKLLTGDGDGMSDSIEAVIHGDKPQRAALADGEFVVPADVVSHLGNGSTSAGAKKLYAMMDKVRMARTGNPNQGKQINSDKYLPA